MIVSDLWYDGLSTGKDQIRESRPPEWWCDICWHLEDKECSQEERWYLQLSLQVRSAVYNLSINPLIPDVDISQPPLFQLSETQLIKEHLLRIHPFTRQSILFVLIISGKKVNPQRVYFINVGLWKLKRSKLVYWALGMKELKKAIICLSIILQ